MSSQEPRIDVEQVMQQIRERVRQRYALAPRLSGAVPASAPLDEAGFNDLRRMIDHARRCAAAIGEQPPRPPTLRGRVGAVLVRLVRRMLFWHTPQIADFSEATLRVIEEQVAALESVSMRLHLRLVELERLAGEASHEGAGGERQ